MGINAIPRSDFCNVCQVEEEINDEVTSAEIVKVAQSVIRDVHIQAEADLVYSR